MMATSILDAIQRIFQGVVYDELGCESGPEWPHDSFWMEPVVIPKHEAVDIMRKYGAAAVGDVLRLRLDEALYKLQNGLGRPAADYPVWCTRPAVIEASGHISVVWWIYAERDKA